VGDSAGADRFYIAAVASAFEDSALAQIVLDRHGLVRMWNRAAERLTGWTRDEVLGKVPPYVPGDQVAAFHHRRATAFEQSDLADLTATRQHKDGRTLRLHIVRSLLRDDQGRAFAILGTLSDVTERERLEDEQRRSEANLRTLIERSPEAIIVHRLGRAVFVNPRAATMLRYAPEALLGMPVLDLVHPDDRPKAADRVRDAGRGLEAPPLHERLLRGDGTIVDAEVIALPITFDGAPAVLAHARDLTERMQFDAELRARDRLVSVGRLAAGVGHEINNPLAYVMASLQVLERHVGGLTTSGIDLAKLVANAREGAERIRVIARDLRTFSRQESDLQKPVDLERLLESCISMAQHEIRHRAHLRRSFAPVPRVMGNEARLGQVFLNLLVNAAQAIGDGGIEDNEIVVATSTDGVEVSVDVRDTGPGMSPEVRARAFEAFFTTKPEGAGSGLGLSICQTIVTSLGGHIRIADASGRGTSVVVVLPAAPRDHPASRPPPAMAPAVRSRRRVLVIDDEPLVASALTTMLEGDETTIASSGEEVLRRLRAGERFDVVICDLTMPRMSGMEVVEAAQSLVPGIERSFLFMTGGATTPAAADFLRSLTRPVIEKPFDPRRVAEAVDGVAPRAVAAGSSPTDDRR
jgi:PAS domain S-box-containing protein